MTNLISITFTSDFAGIKAGTTRKVSEATARKLLDVYHVIDDPFNRPPSIMSIRLLAKLPEYGSGWYPHSEHLISGEIGMKLIEEGKAVRSGETFEPEEDTEPERCRGGIHCRCPEKIAAWLAPLNYPSDRHKINAISLAYQISDAEASRIFEKVSVII